MAQLGAGLDDRRPRRRASRRPGVLPGPELALPTGLIRQRPPAYQRRQGRGREGVRARAARGGGRDAGARGHGVRVRAALARGRPRGVRDRVLVRDLRAHPHRRPRRRLLRGAARTRDRPVRRRRRRAERVLPLASTLGLFRSALLARRRPRRPFTGWPCRRRAPGRARARVARAGRRRPRCCCSTPTGRSRSPQERDDGLLKPVVGFRG